MNEPKETIDYIIIWLPIVFSLISIFIAYLAYSNSEHASKSSFLNNLRGNIKKLKLEFINLQDREYTHIERMSIIEVYQDLLLYLGYKEEKKKYLNKEQKEKLSELYLTIEDYSSLIFNSTNILENKRLAKEEINSLLKIL